MSKQPFICSLCEKTFKFKHSLNKHRMKIHGISSEIKYKPFSCAHCEKKFTTKGSLNAHKVQIHRIPFEAKHKPFTCLLCNKKFAMKKTLRVHEVNIHGISHETPTYICATCNECFERKMRLLKHIRQNHSSHTFVRSSRLLCPVNCCSELFPSYRRLREHITAMHNYSLEVEYLEFSNLEEFQEWKDQYENKRKAHYILNRQKTIRKDGVTYYYLCHRSFNSRQQVSNNGKYKKPSHKIGKCCPSTILVKENKYGISVTVCHTHVGHTCDIETVPLSNRDRSIIVEKLSEGVPAQRILHDIRNSAGNEGLQRIHLLKRKDIYNIRKQFSIKYSSERSEDNLTNVKMWVDEIPDHPLSVSPSQMMLVPTNYHTTDDAANHKGISDTTSTSNSSDHPVFVSNLQITENSANRKELNETTIVPSDTGEVINSNTDKLKGMIQFVLGLIEQTTVSDETTDKVVKHLHSIISLISSGSDEFELSNDPDKRKKNNSEKGLSSPVRKSNFSKLTNAHESIIKHELLNNNTNILNLITNNGMERSYSEVIVFGVEHLFS